MAGEDPQQQLAKAKLEASIRRYQEAVSRIDGASMELEIARTAFKYSVHGGHPRHEVALASPRSR